MDLDLENEEFQSALELIRDTDQTFFLTGKAGTGKTTFLKHIIESVDKNFVVVAPTGIAAVNINGVTIHSFFQFPLRPLLPEDEDIKVFWKNSEKRKIISAMDTLVIDEISMVRADIIDGIDFSLRKNGGNPNLPFGGKQVVFVGDLFQLEPVTIKATGEKQILDELYESPYFFNATIFNTIELISIELQKVYRQTDTEFIDLLDKIRIKNIEPGEIKKINTRVVAPIESGKSDFAITLTTRNDLADGVNQKELARLSSEPHTYIAEVSGKFEESKYPTEPELTLKVGAQVIFIKNDSNRRWVNGSIGQICGLGEADITVKLENGNEFSIEKKVWENIEYQYDRKKKKISQETVGTFQQYPLKLAWAITIHKSQGLTFDRVIVDLGSGTFASGQAYVALSRATSFEGLFLKHRLNSTDIYIDEEIKEFAKTFNDSEKIVDSLKRGKTNRFAELNLNREKQGIVYFEKAVNSLIKGEFKIAYNQFISGFELVSCDCELITLITQNIDEITFAIRNSQIDCSTSELDFIRSLIYFFTETESSSQNETDNLNKSLTFIDAFIESFPNSEIGHHLKGRILCSLKDFSSGMLELESSLEIKETPRGYYRIGRINEQRLDENGIAHLYNSILLNPSSPCVYRWFKDFCSKRELKFNSYRNSRLARAFNKFESDNFKVAVRVLLRDGTFPLTDGNLTTAETEFKTFLQCMSEDREIFNPIEEDEPYDDSDEMYDNDYYSDYQSPLDSPYYNDNLDMDQQSPEFWDNI